MFLISIACYALPYAKRKRFVAREIFITVAIFLFTGALSAWQHWLVLGFVTAICYLFHSLLSSGLPPKLHLELEIASPVCIASTLWIIIHHLNLTAAWTTSFIPLTELRKAAYLLAGALLIYSVRGGTSIVRGILERGGSMPSNSPALDQDAAVVPVSRSELNHGRMIGDVERVILALLVANGQFAALAFFFAGKGLIRSKDLESRAWADYLLLGSLSSFLVALVVGILIWKLMTWN
jgi:hypothetical protein